MALACPLFAKPLGGSFVPVGEMLPYCRLLTTTSLCFALGAFAGWWCGPSATAPGVANATAGPAPILPGTTSPAAKPPPFTSAAASMEWVRARMQKGDTTAAERFFHHDAGLTDEQRIGLARELMQNARRMDPHVLARIILGLPRGQAADTLLWRLVSDWSTNDAEAALLFIETLPPDRLNTVGVLTNSAFGLSRLPAERVLALAARLDDHGRSYLAEGLVGFADQAGSWRNTAAILAKLNGPSPPDAISAEWMLGMRLAEIAPQSLESQLTTETDPAKRDKLLQGYAHETGRNDPPRGLEMDARIQDPKVREKHIKYHTEHWLESDRTAALAWLRSPAAAQLMDREQRAKLLRTYHLEAVR
ncbi:MAG TPA: hypothetical protein DIT64_00855 [Verrucomicrobiales bacterium]|nr:hypothetical protein [Verrucomicrobiales bacterium]